jgi:peroxiredoxin
MVRGKGGGMARVSLDSPAPDFELTDYQSRPFRLADLKGQKNVLIVFNRGFT